MACCCAQAVFGPPGLVLLPVLYPTMHSREISSLLPFMSVKDHLPICHGSTPLSMILPVWFPITTMPVPPGLRKLPTGTLLLDAVQHAFISYCFVICVITCRGIFSSHATHNSAIDTTSTSQFFICRIIPSNLVGVATSLM